MSSWKSIFALGVCAILVIGCGPKKPEGIPPLFPAQITVQNAGSPIADANVLLVGGPSGSWSVSGFTNSSGVAVVATSQGDWKSTGVPAGDYKVYITKAPKVQQEPLAPELQNDSDAIEKHAVEFQKLMAAAPKEIPMILTNPARTPLTLTVSADGKAELVVDVSEYQE